MITKHPPPHPNIIKCTFKYPYTNHKLKKTNGALTGGLGESSNKLLDFVRTATTKRGKQR